MAGVGGVGVVNGLENFIYDSNGNILGLETGGNITWLEPSPVSTLIKKVKDTTRQIGGGYGSDISEVVPSKLTGTAYYIDNLNGSASDVGAGTSKTVPWANVSNLDLKTFTTGDTIYIANDNVFNYEQTLSSYVSTPLFTYEGAGTWKSTDADRPITIKPYYPRGYTTIKPIIRYYANVVAGDWTNTATNIWRISCNATFETIVSLGASSILSPMDTISNSNPALLDRAGEWTVTPGTYLFMYCPTNPSTFYGTIKISTRGVINTGWNGMNFVRLSGLRFELCLASIIDILSNTATTSNVSLEVDNCEFIQAKVVAIDNQAVVNAAAAGGASINGTIVGTALTVNSTTAGNVKIGQMLTGTGIVKVSGAYPLVVSGSGASWVISNSQTVTAIAIECIVPSEIKLSVHDNYFEDCPGMAVKLSPNINGHPQNTISWEVYRNRLMGGNSCFSTGALVYTAAVGGTKHIAWGNYGSRVKMYRKSTSDGCLLYAELSSKNTIFYGNIIEQSKTAMQFNNAENCIVISNLAIDCLTMQLFTMAPDGNTPLASYIVANNTFLWTGRYLESSLPDGNVSNTSPIWSQWNDQYPINQLSNFIFVNNLAMFVGGTATKPMLSYISAQIANKLVAGNAAIGFGVTNLVKDNGADVSTTSEFVNFIGSSSDIPNLFPNALRGVLDFRLSESHPLYGKGVSLNIDYNDIAGRKFDPLAPSIGCVVISKMDEAPEWVRNAISQSIKEKCEVEIYGTGAEKLHQGTTTETTLDSFILPKYSLGKNGYLRIDLDVSAINNANVKTINIKMGGTTVCAYQLASQDGIKSTFKIRNKNSYVAQTRTAALVSGNGYSVMGTNAFDTKINTLITVTAVLATATDNIVRLGISAFTKYGA
jgi:hypothetical protein